MNTLQIAVIVDPYSSSTLYVSEFVKYKVSCIAIQSSLLLLVHFVQNFILSDFIKVLPLTNKLLLSLSAQNIVAIVAGCDTRVSLADSLSKILSLSRNDPITSLIWRYKDQMYIALEKFGLRHINTTVFTSFEAFSNCSNIFDDKTSFIIKLINSIRSKGVRVTKGCQGLVKAIKASAQGQVNILGEINSRFVV